MSFAVSRNMPIDLPEVSAESVIGQVESPMPSKE